MLPYLILFAVVALGAIVAGLNPGRGAQRALTLVAIGITLMVGLRREVGADWNAYLVIYDYIKMANLGDALQRTEAGYAFLNLLAGKVGWGIWFPNLVCAAIFMWGLLKFCRQQPNPALGLLVAVPYFIIGVGMGYTRQSAALGFVLIALTQYSNGAYLRMVASIGLAALFHTSALVLVPLLAVASAPRGPLTLLMVAVFGAFLIFQFSAQIQTRLSFYTERTFTATGAVPRILMNVVPALIFLNFRRRFSTNPDELRLWTVFSLASILSLLLLSFVSSSTLVDRLGIYLIPLQVYVLSRVPGVFGGGKGQSMPLLVGIMAYSLAVELVWLTMGRRADPWVPYENYLLDEFESETQQEMPERPKRPRRR